jgi:hypothetical protein
MNTDKTHETVQGSSALPPCVKLRHQSNIPAGVEDNDKSHRGGLKGIWTAITYPIRLYKAFDSYTKPLQQEYFSQCALIRMVNTQRSDKLKYDFFQGQSEFTAYEHGILSEIPWQTDSTNTFPKVKNGTTIMDDNQRRSEYHRQSKGLSTHQKAQLKAAWDSLILETKRVRSEMLDNTYDDENHFKESINAVVKASCARIASAADAYGTVSRGNPI